MSSLQYSVSPDSFVTLEMKAQVKQYIVGGIQYSVRCALLFTAHLPNAACVSCIQNICILCIAFRNSRMVVCCSEHSHRNAQIYTWPAVGGQGLTGERVVFICQWKSRRLVDRLHVETPLHGFLYISLGINLLLSFYNPHLALSSRPFCSQCVCVPTQVSIQIPTSD